MKKARQITRKILASTLAALMILGAAPLAALSGIELPDIGHIAELKASAADNLSNDGKYYYRIESGAIITGVQDPENISEYLNIPPEIDGYPVVGIDDENLAGAIGFSAYKAGFVALLNWMGSEGGIINIPAMIVGLPVTYIGERAFCSYSLAKDKITEVILPNTLTQMGCGAFMDCKNLSKIVLPDSLVYIGENAFTGTAISEINIPSSVEEMDISALTGCKNLKAINVDEENKFYSSDESGVLYNKDKTELILYPMGKTETEYVVPDSVTKIADYAFAACTSLRNVHISSNVTEIGREIFADYEDSTWSAYICSDDSSSEAKRYADENGYTFMECTGHEPLPAEASVSIQNYDEFNGKTFNYRTTFVFSAEYENTAEESIEWYINGKKAGSGKTFTVKEAKEDFEIYCTAESETGETVTGETASIKIENNFFAKIIAFFLGLFRLLPVIAKFVEEI